MTTTPNLPDLHGGWPSRAAFSALDQDEHLSAHTHADAPGDEQPSDSPHHVGLEARVAAIVEPTIADMGYELVRVAILGRNTPTVQIMADRADGALITVEDCEAISHAVSAVMDVEDPMPGRWTLEVSSAGIDRPLTRRKDWNRFAGHLARVEMAIPLPDNRRRFSGVIIGADLSDARLRLDDGAEVALPLADIRRAKLVLTDALIEATANPPLTH